MLTENLLQSLIQYLPSPDQLNKLQEHASDFDNLAEAEQFAISLADIKRQVHINENHLKCLCHSVSKQTHASTHTKKIQVGA